MRCDQFQADSEAAVLSLDILASAQLAVNEGQHDDAGVQLEAFAAFRGIFGDAIKAKEDALAAASDGVVSVSVLGDPLYYSSVHAAIRALWDFVAAAPRRNEWLKLNVMLWKASLIRERAKVLESNPDLRRSSTADVKAQPEVEEVEWSVAKSPSEWQKELKMSDTTWRRRVKGGVLVVNKINNKLVRISVESLSKFQQ